VSNLRVEQEKIRAAVIKYVKEAYRLSVNTRVPSLRGEICKHVKDKLGISCYPDKLQLCFPSALDGPGPLMKRICKASAVRYPRERVRLAKKAFKRKKHKSRACSKHKPTGQAIEDETSEGSEEMNRLKILRRSHEITMEQQALRIRTAKESAKEFYMLATDPLEEVRHPVLDAYGKVLPKILKRCYKINLGLWGIKKLEEIMEEKDLTYEQLQQIIKWTELSDEEQQALLDLPKKLPGVTLAVIAEYAKLTDQERQGVRDLCGLALAKHMKVMELLAYSDFKKRFEEDGVESIKL